MDLFNITIVRILSEEVRKRIVVVTMETSFYSGIMQETKGFLKADWRCVKEKMLYSERLAIDPSMFDYFESLSDDEFAKRYYSVKLCDFTDEEIVEEFNRRLNDKLFHHIQFVGYAAIKE